jgi:hypothetical protein
MQAPCACTEEAALVKATADLMRLPHVAVNTALVFLHRFNSAPPSLGIPENVSPPFALLAEALAVAGC